MPDFAPAQPSWVRRLRDIVVVTLNLALPFAALALVPILGAHEPWGVRLTALASYRAIVETTLTVGSAVCGVVLLRVHASPRIQTRNEIVRLVPLGLGVAGFVIAIERAFPISYLDIEGRGSIWGLYLLLRRPWVEGTLLMVLGILISDRARDTIVSALRVAVRPSMRRLALQPYGAGLLAFATFLLHFGLQIDRAQNLPESANVVMIVVDTVRADHLSSYGYERNTSPATRRLARDGVFFENALSPAPWTTPAMAAVFTGHYPGDLGFEDVPIRLPLSVITMTEILRSKNYVTHGITGNMFAGRPVGLDQGFDHFDDGDALGHRHVSSASISDKAIAFLESSSENPFFLYLHYFDPHFDYIGHEGIGYAAPVPGDLAPGASIQELRARASEMSEAEVQRLRALYDEEIRYTEDHVLRVLAKLEDLGLYEDALVVYLSDHGEEIVERDERWIGHTRTLYQELLHVPLVVKFPGGANAGRVVEERVGLIDVPPTLLETLGIDPPAGYGRAGTAWRPEAPASRPLFAETRRWVKLLAVVKDDWKLIVDETTGRSELYDLADDPGERHNVAAEQRERVAALRQLLDTWSKALAPKTDARPAEFSDEEHERLEALGYIREAEEPGGDD